MSGDGKPFGTHPLDTASRPASSLRQSCATGDAVVGALDRMSAAALPASPAAAARPVVHENGPLRCTFTGLRALAVQQPCMMGARAVNAGVREAAALQQSTTQRHILQQPATW